MENVQFIDLTGTTALVLVLVGFIGGMVSGFIGSGGAFVLTPAMMSLGVPGVVAVASNMAHKFPKALVGAYKRNKYGQVDIKLGLIMGIFAEAGVLSGKQVMVGIREAFGTAGTNLYVSFVLVLVLGIFGGFVLRDGLRERRGDAGQWGPRALSAGVRWVRSLHIPGTMVHFRSMDAEVSILVLAPLGFSTGLLAASIAVGGFIGVPAMMYILGLSALNASGTELVIAFVMGLGGSFLYALDGFVDIRLSMIILGGSLFGIQVGAIGTTYVKDYVVKFVMAAIMLLVLVSRFFYIPGYLSELGTIDTLAGATVSILDGIGQGALAFALIFGAVMILQALYKGMREHRLAEAAAAAAAVQVAPAVPRPAPAVVAAGPQLSPLGRFERFLVASDGSEFSAAAVREGIGMAKKCGGELHVMSLLATGVEHRGLGEPILKQEMELIQAHLDEIKGQAAVVGVVCKTHLIHGQTVYREIVDLAERLKADVIVMGLRGRVRMIVGHATAHVIGQAPCSVLVVPHGAKVEGWHIVLATEGSRAAEMAAVSAVNLARCWRATVTVVSVVTHGHRRERRAEAEQAVQRVVRHMKDEGIAAGGAVLKGHPAHVIAGVARQENAALIVTGNRGCTGFERLLIGSTSERILHETPCGVLLVKGG
jgi:nucleotide-binding universal stress UspA family protein/uncharacterized membrane protein YfcA